MEFEILQKAISTRGEKFIVDVTACYTIFEKYYTLKIFSKTLASKYIENLKVSNNKNRNKEQV